MEKVVVFGAGGFGREVIEIFKDSNKVSRKWDILGFLDGNPQMHGKDVNGFTVLGGAEWLADHPDVGCVVAIGDPDTKKRIVENLDIVEAKFVNAVHPSVAMSEFITLGKGVIICAGCILTVNIVIGNHVIININSTIGHDTIIGNFCSIMPAVCINGEDSLGEGVYVGTGTKFIQNITVGAWTTLGAGSVVVKDIPEKVLALGVPAKVVKVLGD